MTLMLLGLASVVGAYLYFAPGLPDADTLKDVELQVPLRVYTRDGRLLAEYGEQRRVPLTLDEIPDELEHAILAAEDDRFYEHPGVDWMGIARAAYYLVTTGSKSHGGGSTITMQVARNFFLSFEQTYTRKIREIFLALKIEQELDKDEILELYLNKIYLGNRAYGVGAAAEIYYGKSIDQLTLAQMAMIATLPKAPSRYNPLADPERALERRAYVLSRMRELGYINNAAFETAMMEPVTAEYHGSVTEVDAPYVAELARADLVQRVGEEAAYTTGYRVVTTLDSRLQVAANDAMRLALQEYDQRYGYRGPVRQLDADILEEMLADGHVRELLAEVPRAGQLQVAVVIDVEDDLARALHPELGEIELPMAGLAWAAPTLPGRNTGKVPEHPSDVLAAGDVIYVLPDAESGWRLAQVPEVQGALVSLDPQDGAVVAMVGGYDFYLSKYNRAVQAHRQPGSSFKPFVYSAALANGFTPATIVNDAPVVFADDQLEDVWRPENDSGRFYGPTRLREALVRSRNLVSIRVMQTMGISTAINYISNTFGFDRDRLPRDLSLALGSGAYSPLEMASAYAVLANGGYRIEPYYIEEIFGPDGASVYRADPAVVCQECEAREQEEAMQAALPEETAAESEVEISEPAELAALDDAVVEALPLTDEFVTDLLELQPPRRAERVQAAPVNFLITDMMRDVVRRGTGVRAMALGRSDIAGKTGTTNEYRDAWFSGFNPKIVTTVWVGFDDFSTLGRGEYGGRAALPGWIDFMRVALDGTPEITPERPPGLVTVRIDPQTGLLAGAGQSDAIFETFVEGTLPAALPESRRTDDDSEDDAEHDLF